jgi:hypothetical protein
MNSVLDTSKAPCHPPEYLAHHDWIGCRAVRERLLEAVRMLGRPQKKHASHLREPQP